MGLSGEPWVVEEEGPSVIKNAGPLRGCEREGETRCSTTGGRYNWTGRCTWKRETPSGSFWSSRRLVLCKLQSRRRRLATSPVGDPERAPPMGNDAAGRGGWVLRPWPQELFGLGRGTHVHHAIAVKTHLPAQKRPSWMAAVVPAKIVEESVGEALVSLGVPVRAAAALIGWPAA